MEEKKKKTSKIVRSIRLNFPSFPEKRVSGKDMSKIELRSNLCFLPLLIREITLLGFILLLLLFLLAWQVLPVSIGKELGHRRANLTVATTRVTDTFPRGNFGGRLDDFEGVTRLSRKKTRSENKSFEVGKRNYVERRWSFAGLIRGVKGIRKKQKLKGWDKRSQGNFDSGYFVFRTYDEEGRLNKY